MNVRPTSICNFTLSCLFFIMTGFSATAQDASVSARIDASRIMVGDQARVFIELKHNASTSRIQWTEFPDSLEHLEIVEKGKIDTLKAGNIVTYKQRLLVTGFDSGAYYVPAFVFPVIPNQGTAYTIQTDSFPLLVQTVAVDTAKPFKGIKDIRAVKGSWMDYIWYIVGAIIFVGLGLFIFFYFIKNKKAAPPPPAPPAPKETLQEQALRMLAALDNRQLWQQNRIKEYYTELTDILRGYIEARYNKPAMELTTEELLASSRRHHEMKPHIELLATILYAADMAKFAKAQPLPQEHVEAMQNTIEFVKKTKPANTENTSGQL